MRVMEKLFGVYPSERADFTRAALLFLSVFFFFAIFRNYVDASFLKRYGPSSIPLMLCLSGAVSITLFCLCRRLEAKVTARGMLSGFFLISSLGQLGLYAMAGAGANLTSPILFQLLYFQDAFLLVYLWSLVQTIFDARQGKRLFRLLMGAQVLGSTFGSLGSSFLASRFGLDAPLLVCAGANITFALVLALALIRTDARPRENTPSPTSSPRPTFTMQVAFEAFCRYPIFRFLCACSLLPNLALPILTYQFGVVAAAAFASEHELLAFLGWFRGGVTLCVFVFITFLGRAYDRFSARDLALTAPVNQCLAFGALGLFFNLPAVAYAQFSSIFLQRAALGPLTKQLFSLLPREIAAWSQVFTRGTLVQASTLSGALLILALKQELTPRAMSLAALVLGILWTLEAVRFRVRYRAGLKQILTEQGLDYDRFNEVAAGLTDTAPSTLDPESYPEEVLELMEELDIPDIDPDAALAGLTSPDAEARAHAAASFALSCDFRAINGLLLLLEDIESVRRAAIDALSRYAPDILPILEQRLSHGPPRVQRGILEALRLARTRDADIVPFLGRQLTGAYNALIAARTLETAPSGPSLSLFVEHLREKSQEELNSAFLALWVTYPDMRLIFVAQNTQEASAAAELLETSLDPLTAARIVPLVDSIPEEERIARGRRVLPLMRGDTPDRVLNALCVDEDPTTRMLALCVLGESFASRSFLPVAEAGLAAPDAAVRAAALYALERCRDQETSMPSIIMHVRSLRTFPLFSGLGVRELRAVASIATPATFPVGAVIIARGQAFPGVHLVLRGCVAARGARIQTAAEIRPGGFFGALGLFSEHPADKDYIAMEEVELFAIPSASFLEIMKLYPMIGVNLCRFFSKLLGERNAIY